MRIAHMGFQPTIPQLISAHVLLMAEKIIWWWALDAQISKSKRHTKNTQINTSIWNRWDRFWICAEIDERERTHLVPDLHFHAPSPRRCPHGIPAHQWNRSTKAGTDQKSRQKNTRTRNFGRAAAEEITHLLEDAIDYHRIQLNMHQYGGARGWVWIAIRCECR